MSPSGTIHVMLAEASALTAELAQVIDASGLEEGRELLTVDLVELMERDRVFLAYEDGSPVGCVMATRDSSPIIHSLIVVAEKRGASLASTILGHAFEHLTALPDAEYLWAAADPNWPSAADRFRALGFVDHQAMDGLDLLRFEIRRAD